MTCGRTYADVPECMPEQINFTPSFVKLPPKSGQFKKQKFDYFLVLDFEATCDSPKTLVPQEVIEFPVLKVSSLSFEVESIFHSYVKPVIHPDLTKFCTQLTGITQDVVDAYPEFEEVFEEFQSWLEIENLLDPKTSFVFVTVGNWDLKYLFPVQYKGLRVPYPEYMKRWINLKASFADLSTVYPRNMVTMMKYCQLEHEGRLHSGIDDCKNIARVLKNLAERGIVYELNGGLSFFM
ncbi:ERI1 exoribonuclease 3 [Trichonephila clavipes]|nr:ERI1 exoribonuclease 3 [Trichonephila clavipes]